MLVVLSAFLVLAQVDFLKICAIYLITSIPLYIVIAIPSLAYAGSYHGFLWPPRFSLLWGLAISIAIVFLAREGKQKSSYIQGSAYAVLLVASIFLQMQVLKYYRIYSYTDRISSPFSLNSKRNLPRWDVVI